MKHRLIAAAAIAISFTAIGEVNPEAILMTVDGRPVTVGEFEYLYNKNNTQQTTPQTLDEYLKMFENYKLKVVDAEHAGIDTTPAFESEFSKFRDELAAPYLIDKATEDALISEAYGHFKTDVSVSHIMLSPEEGNAERLDSIRTAILSGSITFEDAASKYSIDRGSKDLGGKMGYVVPGRFPWAFEKASYDTAEGSISPVINSGVGYHIIRPESVTTSKGDVDASHILIMTRGLDEKAQTVAKERIDSAYAALKAGADFAQLAEKISQDPGSARRGGSLGRFGHGVMVAEFDSAAYATPAGEFSKPFRSAFGYHIVKTNETFGVPALDDNMRKTILEGMARDERANAASEAKLNQLMAQYNASVDQRVIERISVMVKNNPGGCDSTMMSRLIEMDDAVASFDGGKVSVRDAIAYIPMAIGTDAVVFTNNLSEAAENALRGAVLDYARGQLAKTNTDYRNLVNEYRDGILLFEISNRRVWDKASTDKEGLKAFFEANKDKYKWAKPKYKGYIFFAQSEPVLNQALAYADSLDTSDAAVFTQNLRKRFGRDLKVERVIAADGENPITDYIGFGGPKEAADKQSRWPFFAGRHGRVIDNPEEAADVRGAAVSDYQAQLEAEWLKELHKKYRVKVNNKVFKQLKKEAN